MKITKEYLKQIIKEEVQKINESSLLNAGEIESLCIDIIEDKKFISKYVDKYREEGFFVNIRQLSDLTRNPKIINLGRDFLTAVKASKSPDDESVQKSGSELYGLIKKIMSDAKASKERLQQVS